MSRLAEKLKALSVSSSCKISADVLECPVCFEICKPPSFECRNGHLICGGCKAKGAILYCPICRVGNLVETNDLKSYRSMCNFPCSNKEDGCKVELSEQKLKEHRRNCKYRPTKCYVDDCQRFVPRNDFRNHITTYHKGRVFGSSDKIPITAEMERQLLKPGKKSNYYFEHTQRVYVVTLEQRLGEGLRMWGKALNPGLVNENLRVVFGVENEEKLCHSSKPKKVLTVLEPLDKDSVFTSPTSCLRAKAVTVRFLKIKATYLPGCEHYKRHCKLKCPLPDCSAIVSCRECHDLVIPSHKFNRYAVKLVVCCSCGEQQPPSNRCERCSQEFAQYFCSKCNLYDDQSDEYDIFHCDLCRMCRRRESKDTEYYHCSCCDICLPVSVRDTHECKYNASKENCSVCSKEMHSSRIPIVPLNCGHYVHKTCRRSQDQGQVDQRCRSCLETRNRH